MALSKKEHDKVLALITQCQDMMEWRVGTDPTIDQVYRKLRTCYNTMSAESCPLYEESTTAELLGLAFPELAEEEEEL